MNSRSEMRGTESHNAVVAALPARLLGPDARGKEVSRLEFHSMERDSVDAAEVREEKAQAAEDSRLGEKVAALDVAMQLQAEAVAAQIDDAKREARQSAREEWERELSEHMADERALVLRTCEQFRRERTRYFAGVEGEVVKLALSIAARVLHRETQLDPLLLTAVVRVALGKVEEGSRVVARVPAGDLAMWRGVFEGTVESGVELVGDDRLETGECVLDTNVGKVELGVSAQLVEIERGFFDLLQQRPS